MKYHVEVKKSGFVYDLDTDTLPEISTQFALEYGFRQFINDGVAGMVRKDYAGTNDEFMAAARKASDHRWNQLVTGAVPKSGRTVDPEAATAAKYGITVEKLREMLGRADAAIERAETAIDAAFDQILPAAETRHPDKKKKVA